MPDIGPFIRTDFKEVDKRDELRNVLGYIRGDVSDVPVITDEGRPFGIVSERAMLGRRIDPKARLEGYALTTRAVTPAATIDEVMARMGEFRAAHLPVQNEKGLLAGYVSALDIVQDKLPRDAKARDLALPVTVLREDQTLSEAHHAFSQEYVDYLPVLDAQGQPSGVVPRRTLISMDSRYDTSKGRKDAGGERIHPQKEPLSGYLDTRAPVIDAGAGLGEVVQKVRDFGCCIVRNGNGGLTGIITAETLVQRASGR